MNRKWTLFTFGAGDYKGVEGYLNRQAAKGWELEKVYGFLARWKRTERPSRWCVDLLNAKADREEKLSYLDLCAEGGWELTALQGSMCIFRSKAGKEPFPVQTDPELEKKNYNKYYLKPTILSVVYILFWLVMMALVVSARNFSSDSVFAALRYGWLDYWTVCALYPAVPVWAVMAVWKVLHFLASLVRNRGGIKPPFPQAMWINSVLAALSTLMGVLVIVALGADRILCGLSSVYIYVLLAVTGGSMIYRGFAIERELLRGEKKRHYLAGAALLLAFALVVAAAVTTPYRDWYTAWYSSDREKAAQVYEQTHILPIVHGEDLGLALDREEESVDMVRQLTPSGQRWEIYYHYGEESPAYGYMGIGSVTVQAPSLWHAKQSAASLAAGRGLLVHAPWPQNELSPVNLDWADEAWYGEYGSITVLVIRMGTTVTRLNFPVDLLRSENLSAIRAELEK